MKHLFASLAGIVTLACAASASATGGPVYKGLPRLLEKYEVGTVFIGQVRGFQRSTVYCVKPVDDKKADEDRFKKYSYVEISFRVVPKKVLRGKAEIGKPLSLTFQERHFAGMVTLQPDGTTEDTGPTALGIISTGGCRE